MCAVPGAYDVSVADSVLTPPHPKNNFVVLIPLRDRFEVSWALTLHLVEILLLSVCWRYFNIQINLDFEAVFTETRSFGEYVFPQIQISSAHSLFARTTSLENGPRTPFRLQWDVPSKYEDFSSDFTPFSLEVHARTPTQIRAAQSGCYRTTPRAPRAPPFLGHGPAALLHADEARKPPRPSPAVIFHVVCESLVQVQTSPQAKFGGKRKKRHFPRWGLCGSVSLPPPLQPAGARILVRGGPAAPPVSPGGTRTAPDGQRAKVGKGAEAY